LGDRFKHAKLLEISENSYLISNNVRLPIFGKQYSIFERTKSSISKRAYLLKYQNEYTNKTKRYQFTKNKDLMSIGAELNADMSSNMN
jgi:hypothetical protein